MQTWSIIGFFGEKINIKTKIKTQQMCFCEMFFFLSNYIPLGLLFCNIMQTYSLANINFFWATVYSKAFAYFLCGTNDLP